MLVTLDGEEWCKIASEKSARDAILGKKWDQIIKVFDNPPVKPNIPTILSLRKAAQLARYTIAKFSAERRLSEYLHSETIIVDAKDVINISEAKPDLQPLTFCMLKKNQDVDFLVFVNSGVSFNETQIAFLNEAIHIVHLERNLQRSMLESIQRQVSGLDLSRKK